MPAPVLESLQNDLVDYRGRGLSVLEMSHRSSDFAEIAAKAESDFRQLLNIPDNYSVLFMQGGASAQFSLCVQNLDQRKKVAYANTGYWAKKAMASAAALTNVVEVTACQTEPLISIPNSKQWLDVADASFLHVTDNETIDGIVFDEIPKTELPIVSDMSSSILSQPVDISKYGMIYAGAQKNIGPAGLTLVLVREDLLGRCRPHWPDVLNYAKQASRESMLNTPPSFAWYLAGLVFEWVREQGGLEAMAVRNQAKASTLYGAIAASDFYRCDVAEGSRSRMNVVFHIHDQSLEPVFVREASDAGLLALKGHSALGGLRASLYNAMPQAGVEALVSFMRDFAQRYG